MRFGGTALSCFACLRCVALLCFAFCKFFASHFGAPVFLLCVSAHSSIALCYLFIVYSFFLRGFLLSLSLSRILVQKQKSSRILLEAHCLCLFVLLFFFFFGVCVALLELWLLY